MADKFFILILNKLVGLFFIKINFVLLIFKNNYFKYCSLSFNLTTIFFRCLTICMLLYTLIFFFNNSNEM